VRGKAIPLAFVLNGDTNYVQLGEIEQYEKRVATLRTGGREHRWHCSKKINPGFLFTAVPTYSPTSATPTLTEAMIDRIRRIRVHAFFASEENYGKEFAHVLDSRCVARSVRTRFLCKLL
jgi:hypothetical protein